MAYLNTYEVMNRSTYSRVQIWRKSRNPKDPFPAPYQLGENRIGWDADEFSAWEQSRAKVAYAPDKSH